MMAVPFVYLGACGWLLHRMTSDQGFSGGQDKSSAGDADNADGLSSRPPPVGWDDVGGMSQAKAAVKEVVDVLHDPGHYARLGARCPRGILLAGPPGTGKTLLARAVASESALPFLSCTGSDFVEVFVGRGARRVRSLFEDAARRAPCVLFIDEIDALGASRSYGGGGRGCEEHEHTLNQVCVHRRCRSWGVGTGEGGGRKSGGEAMSHTTRSRRPRLHTRGRHHPSVHVEAGLGVACGAGRGGRSGYGPMRNAPSAQ